MMHIFEVSWEEMEDHRFKTVMICPECGRHVENVTGLPYDVIVEGDKFAVHDFKIMMPIGINTNISDIQVVPSDDDTLKPFKDFLDNLQV